MYDIKYFFIQLLIFSSSFAEFTYKVGPCIFDYHQKKCGLDEGDSEKLTPLLKGYYWRPYINGIIPGDAYPISKATQTPRTFVGMVYDPSREGSIIVTIVEGMKTVNSIGAEDKVNKLNDDIKILCSQEQDQFYGYNVSDPNRPPSSDFLFLRETVHLANKTKHVIPWVTITWKCNIAYASSVVTPTEPSQFVTFDGSLESSKKYLFLTFSKKAMNDGKDKKEMKSNSFISHRYKYSIKSDSIIPNYYKLLRIGSFSMLCTNEGGAAGSSSTKVPDYFWTPKIFFSKEIAIPFGNNSKGEVYYAGQATNSKMYGENIGRTNGDTVYIVYPRYTATYSFPIHILGTLNQKRFTWMPSTSQEFNKMDTRNLVRGGYLPNGTRIYVGRGYEGGISYPASIQKLQNSAYVSFAGYNQIYTTTDKFEVLYYKED